MTDGPLPSRGHRFGCASLLRAEALLESTERPGARRVSPRDRLGLFHCAILLPDRAALAHFAGHATKLGMGMGMSDHLVSEALYFSDPDGLGIEVYADRPRSAWRWRDGQLVMATDPLDLESLLAEADDGSFRGVPETTRMGHVHLHVGSLKGADAFYHEALGLDRTVWSYPGALFLSAGGYHHHLGLNTWAGRVAPAGEDDARPLSWTLVLPDEAAVARTGDGIEAGGHRMTMESGLLAVADPWGTVLEVVAAAG